MDPSAPVELYRLDVDPNETTDVAEAHPEIVAEMLAFMTSSHTPSVVERWNIPAPGADAGEAVPEGA